MGYGNESREASEILTSGTLVHTAVAELTTASVAARDNPGAYFRRLTMIWFSNTDPASEMPMIRPKKPTEHPLYQQQFTGLAIDEWTD